MSQAGYGPGYVSEQSKNMFYDGTYDIYQLNSVIE